MSRIQSLRRFLVNFFTAPVDPKPLSVLRILLALFAIVQAALWYSDWSAFFGQDGWMQWEISQALTLPWQLHVSTVAEWLGHLGLDDTQSLEVFYWIYVGSIVGLLIGWHTRVWATLTWFCHYIIMSSLPTYVYGVDIFLHIGLFYLMILPVSKWMSLDVRQDRVSPLPSWGATLGLRVLQIHMCLVYISSGSEKMFAREWWDGNVLWRSMVQPDFRQFDLTWLAHYSWIVMLLSWFTMVTEVGYCVGVWIPRVRVYWLLAITFLHLGIGLFLGLWLFGIIMILLTVSAFGEPAWNDVLAWRRSRAGRRSKQLQMSTAIP